LSKPLISVIIPDYNAEKSIGDALDSVFAQTYRPIEIIVVDDGSTDGTAEIVKGYVQNARTVRGAQDVQTGEAIDLVYIYQDNGGPSKARNAGIKASHGKYIAFLDADDVWKQDKLEKQLRIFVIQDDIDIVFSDVKITRLNKGKVEEFSMFQKKGFNKDFFGHEFLVIDPLKKFLQINFMHTSAVMLKKSCFSNGLFFNEKRCYAEDWELWLTMSLYYKFAYVRAACVYVRAMDDGLSSHEKEMYLSNIDILESFVKERRNELAKFRITDSSLSEHLKDSYKWMGYYFMQNKKNKLARIFYKKSLKKASDIKTIFYYFLSFLKII
jgi:glycosyltransferase involved in cell wall biosynthesis